MFNFTLHVCVEIFHIMNIDVPPGVGAPPLQHTTFIHAAMHKPV